MLLRRCIYVYESGFHSSFLKAAKEGTARMDYEYDDGNGSGSGKDSSSNNVDANRMFFHALYDHAMMASRRGCRRSSLELLKLLYQLDTRDPMGVLLMYDRCSLRASQHGHVMNIFETCEGGAVRRLPNWLYSYALATALSSTSNQNNQNNKNNSKKSNQTDNKNDKVDNENENEKTPEEIMARAKRMLTRAILSYPQIAIGLLATGRDHFKADPLFAAERIRPTTTRTTQEDGKNNNEKSNAFDEERSLSILNRLTTAYTKQSKALWSNETMQHLLESSMQEANVSFLESDGTSVAMLERRWTLLSNGDLLCYEGLDFNDEISSIPGEDPGAGIGGGGGGGGGGIIGPDGRRTDTGQMELDPTDPAMMLMLQLLMPWNTLTPLGVAHAPQQQTNDVLETTEEVATREAREVREAREEAEDDAAELAAAIEASTVTRTMATKEDDADNDL